MSFQIIPVPDDEHITGTLAMWSITEWGADFPDDTIDTYRDLYRASCDSSSGRPRVFVAVDDTGKPIGTVTFIDDDELPDAIEPGPWLAALFVTQDRRGEGVGQALVEAVVTHARHLHIQDLYLYTADQVEWYSRMGWRVVRTSQLSGRVVTVMTYKL